MRLIASCSRDNFCGRYVTASCGCFADSTSRMKDTARRVDVYRSRIAIQYDRRCAAGTAARRCRHSRNYPTVIIRAAIVVVINQSLTLPDLRIAIYAEYLVYAPVYESVERLAKASVMKGERYRLQNDINFGAEIKINLDNRIELCARETQ